MSYVLPTFNLSVNIWRPGNPTWNPPDVQPTGNLALGRRVGLDVPIDYYSPSARGLMWLLLPAGTDIRDSKAAAGADTVEVPAGSSRYYKAVWVDDIGGGFSNEHRFAMLDSLTGWPTPFPKCVGPYPPQPGNPLSVFAKSQLLWPTGGTSISVTSATAGVGLLLMMSDASGGTQKINGNPAQSGTSVGVTGVRNAICGVWPISWGVGTTNYAITYTGSPPSVENAYVIVQVTIGYTTLESNTFLTGSGAPTNTPSGWVGPPTVPALFVPVAFMGSLPTGSTPSINSPYIQEFFESGGGWPATWAINVAVEVPSALLYSTWTLGAATFSGSYGAGTLMIA